MVLFTEWTSLKHFNFLKCILCVISPFPPLLYVSGRETEVKILSQVDGYHKFILIFAAVVFWFLSNPPFRIVMEVWLRECGSSPVWGFSEANPILLSGAYSWESALRTEACDLLQVTLQDSQMSKDLYFAK